jgi:hypothetical protein
MVEGVERFRLVRQTEGRAFRTGEVETVEDADDVAGEALGERPPHAAVGDARVHQQDRGTLAADLVVQRHAFAAS